MGRVPADLVVVTFNVLCPVYKRLGGECRRESERPALWRARLTEVIQEIASCSPTPDVICLQEFWFAAEAVALFREAFGSTYTFHLTKRPGKEDGLATLIRNRSRAFTSSEPTATHEFTLLPGSDRVAQLVSLRLAAPSLHPEGPVCALPAANCMPREVVIVNTHLTFPHGKLMHRLRLEQARSITRAVSAFAAKKFLMEPQCGGLDALVLGDLNGGPSSRVCGHLRNANYTSALAEIWGDAAPATHHNHLGESVFVDHVFLRRFFPQQAGALAPKPNLLGFLRVRSSRTLRPIEGASAPRRDFALLRGRPTLRKARPALPPATGTPAADDDAASVDSVESATLTYEDSGALRSAGLVGGGPPSAAKRPGDQAGMLYATSQSMGAIDESASALGCSVAPLHARVLPDGVPTDCWPKQARCSDHRPVCAEFRYSWCVLARKTDQPSGDVQPVPSRCMTQRA